MLRPLAITATVLGLLTSGPLLADGAGHNNGDTRPNQVDSTYQHTHEAGVSGVVHTHEVNGVRIKHAHRKQTVVGERVAKVTSGLERKERAARSRYQVGAGYGPYTVAEYRARLAAGQPGLSRIQEPLPRRAYRNQD